MECRLFLGFARVLRRSYTKLETAAARLQSLDFVVVEIDPTAVDGSHRDVIEELIKQKKFVYLAARAEEGPVREQMLRVDGRVVVEHSPIFVSILFLTEAELIVYAASIDMTKGDLLIERINRFFLKDVVEVTSTSRTIRRTRSEDPAWFASHEKLLGIPLPDEFIITTHFLRVSMTDAKEQAVPIGAPEYRFGKEGVLDSDDDNIENRYTSYYDDTATPPSPESVASGIYKRICDQKADIRPAEANRLVR